MSHGHAWVGNGPRRVNVPRLGNHIQKGIIVKIADDLYCGGDSPAQLLANWERVLKPSNDVIFPCYAEENFRLVQGIHVLINSKSLPGICPARIWSQKSTL